MPACHAWRALRFAPRRNHNITAIAKTYVKTLTQCLLLFSRPFCKIWFHPFQDKINRGSGKPWRNSCAAMRSPTARSRSPRLDSGTITVEVQHLSGVLGVTGREQRRVWLVMAHTY
eukprot:1261996-Amphidinium_carterae.1